jgi:hypothetical protein
MNYTETLRQLKQIGKRYAAPIAGASPVPGVNPLTPDVAFVGRLSTGLVVELSLGEGLLSDGLLYGVTFWDEKKPGPNNLSACVLELDQVAEVLAQGEES